MMVCDLDRMPVRELRTWQAFFTIWRFPLEQADLSSAVLSQIVANIMRPKNVPSYAAQQFLVGRRFGYNGAEDTKPKDEASKHFAAFGWSR